MYDKPASQQGLTTYSKHTCTARHDGVALYSLLYTCLFLFVVDPLITCSFTATCGAVMHFTSTADREATPSGGLLHHQ
jgi:hypothetical protein